jgi:NADH-quinone oxidoreductase subunit M
MNELFLPYLTAGVVTPLVVALMVPGQSEGWRRVTALMAAGFSALCFAVAGGTSGGVAVVDPLIPWLTSGPLTVLPLVFYALMTVAVLLMAPKRDADGSFLAGVLILLGGTSLANAAANLGVMTVGWWVTLVPFLAGLFGSRAGLGRAERFQVVAGVLLTVGVVLLKATGVDGGLREGGGVAFGLLAMATVLRKGVFPLHAGTMQLFERGPLLPAGLLFNGHLGALMVARLELEGLTESGRMVMDVAGMVALAGALLAAVRAFAERKPRRLLALIAVSQASFILAGLATRNMAGVTGALVHWMVVAAASMGMACVLRAVEVRVADALAPVGPLGLAVRAPRLAVFFLVCGLALIGLPGTLGYCAEDLLFHGALESHPLLGVALPLATALNAVHIMRLFGVLFLGVLPKDVPNVPDVLVRERWGLSAFVVFLVACGIVPRLLLATAVPAAETMHAEETHHDAGPTHHGGSEK